MNALLQRRFTSSMIIALAAFPLGAALSGCGSGPGESESKMTSFTASESKADTAELFTVPKEQMAHLQIVPAGKGSASAHASPGRRRRLQCVRNHAGVCRDWRPGARNSCRTRPIRPRGPAAPYRHQPGLLRGALRVHQGARGFHSFGQIVRARSGPLHPRRDFRSRSAAGGDESQSGACRPGILRRRPARARRERSGSLDQKCRAVHVGKPGARPGHRRYRRAPGWPGAVAAERRHTMLHHFQYQQRVGAGERLPERPAVCARGGRRRNQHRQLPGTVSRENFLSCARA